MQECHDWPCHHFNCSQNRRILVDHFENCLDCCNITWYVAHGLRHSSWKAMSKFHRWKYFQSHICIASLPAKLSSWYWMHQGINISKLITKVIKSISICLKPSFEKLLPDSNTQVKIPKNGNLDISAICHQRFLSYEQYSYILFQIIESPSSSYIVELTFIGAFDIETKYYGAKCNDYLEIRDGPYGFSPLIAKVCGNESPRKVASSGNAVWLRFVSDHYLQFHGFQVQYTFLPSPRIEPSNETSRQCDKKQAV